MEYNEKPASKCTQCNNEAQDEDRLCRSCSDKADITCLAGGYADEESLEDLTTKAIENCKRSSL